MKTITIIGNLGSNATRRVDGNGRELMTFNVAVNRANDKPIWFNCIGNLREKLLPYLVKGQAVCVIGELNASVYRDSVDLQVSIDKIELCGARPDDATPDNSQVQ